VKDIDVSFKYRGWLCEIDTIIGGHKRQLYCTKSEKNLQLYFKPKTSTKEICNIAKDMIRAL